MLFEILLYEGGDYCLTNSLQLALLPIYLAPLPGGDSLYKIMH